MSLIDSAALWASLPLPALVIGPDGAIADVNPAAETFLNTSRKSLMNQPLLDRLAIDAPMENAIARTRAHLSPLFISEADITTGERAPVQCALQLAPLQDAPGHILLLISPREVADRLGRAMQVTSAAKSAIGMAEMLAHEIKNPLAGIAGAAQLLAMGLTPQDQELTDLIVEETRRVVKLLEQVEQFGNLRPPARGAVNLHDALVCARRSAFVGFCVQIPIIEVYEPSPRATGADPEQLI